ncbi:MULTISPECIES: flagellar export protein FliJ [Gracilibacillus]|uniref:flagellar export protein FliJ n=1 Tax=Gracilibacillus TaxID=74385 RepID=UPI0008270A3B|nr:MULTISPECIES: flagellar export protein FliJ [Gracilibacillus]
MEEWHGYEKIKRIRDNEKDQTELAFREAVADFEQRAEQLYDLLKQKEDIEQAYKQSLSQSVPIETLRSYHQYLDFLTPSIITLQQQVNQARTKMQSLQERVAEDYIEVKKIDKLIEKKKVAFHQMEKRKEAFVMDEISLRQFMHR